MVHLDYECRSELDLNVVGLWKYATHPSTEVIMVSWSVGNGEVKQWDASQGPIPDEFLDILRDPFTMLAAWNTAFERVISMFCLRITTDIGRWVDPMIQARYMSMPGSLDKVSEILQLKEGKMDTLMFIKNQYMIDFFCKPLQVGGWVGLFGVEPTTYRDWNTHPKEWNLFCKYNKQDVEAERAAERRMSKFHLPESEYFLFELDQQINDRGMYTDPMLIQGASVIVEKEKTSLITRMKELTGLDNPNSRNQILAWVRPKGYIFASIGKGWVRRALAGECELEPEAIEVLNLRLQLSKSGVSKLEALRQTVCNDGRVRHMLSFMGAARTGRWSGGGIQPQNLLKASKEVEKKFELAISLLKAADYEGVKANFSSPIDVASAAIRPSLCAAPGKKLIIADLSAVESRGAGWMAECESLLDIFRENRDPYVVFAAQMAGRPYEEMYAEYKAGNKTDRTNAKPGFLGSAYGLGPGGVETDADGDLVKTGLLGYADNMGIQLTQEQSELSIEVFRNAYPEIVEYWYALHRAFVEAVQHDKIVQCGKVSFEMKGRVLCLNLPSGRSLHYINPKVEEEERVSKRTGKPYKQFNLYYDGIHQETRQWTQVNTRGAKLFENIVQAICRDVLAYGMIKATEAGFDIVLHVHDEIVAEVPIDSPLTYKDLERCMSESPSWGLDFLLGAAGFESQFYTKD